MYDIETELVNVSFKDQHNPASMPLYQTATFHLEDLNSECQYDYTRSGNPTRTALQTHLAKIMGNAHAAFAVSTGMYAWDVISRLLNPGDEVIAGLDMYGGSSRFLTYLTESIHITSHNVDTTKVDDVVNQVNEKTKIILLESPTNPGMQICDIRTIAKAAKEKNSNVIVVVDNTMMSPLNMNPFELGADIWYESATKYLSGHHDMMGGVIALKCPKLADKIYYIINMNGAGMAPFDSWLLLRGLKTLGVRFDRQQENAIAVANFLKKIAPKVKTPKFEVLYPGLEDSEGYEIFKSMSKGPAAVLSFRTHDVALSEKIVQATKIFEISVSFGAVNSLISLPCKMSHASIDPAIRKARGFPEDIIRLCIGIESSKDLVEDLHQAFITAGVLEE